MELLQNRIYKPWEIPDSYFHEIRTLVESIIDICKEGEISAYEAENVIHKELLCCLDYQSELWEKLENFDNEIEDDYIESEGVKILGFKASYADFIKKDLQNALDVMEDYNNFLIKNQTEIEDIFESTDYQKKRKIKIKQQIIRDGLKLTSTKADDINIQTSKMNITERYINHLITVFPEFETDYPLLIKHEYLEITKTGLHWKKTKQSLAEYFNSIKPKTWKEMKWNPIETAFGEKNLKSSLSRNGNVFKGASEDFIKWLEIKKAFNG